MQWHQDPGGRDGTITLTITSVTPPGAGSLGRDYTAISEVTVTGGEPADPHARRASTAAAFSASARVTSRCVTRRTARGPTAAIRTPSSAAAGDERRGVRAVDHDDVGVDARRVEAAAPRRAAARGRGRRPAARRGGRGRTSRLPRARRPGASRRPSACAGRAPRRSRRPSRPSASRWARRGPWTGTRRARRRSRP